MAKKPAKRPTRGPKHPYRTPRLIVHGDLRAVTLVKRGLRNDGGRKPRTRASGGNA